MADQLIPLRMQIDDDNGLPLALGTIETYEAGTSTPLTAYQDSGASTALPWPIELNAAGVPVNSSDAETPVYVTENAKIIVKDSDGATVYTLTQAPNAFASGSAASAISHQPNADNAATNVQDAIDNNTTSIATLEGEDEDIYERGTFYATYGGSANAIELTTGRSLTALTTGQEFRFRASSANTGATTIDVDGIGTVTAKTKSGDALPSGYIRTDVDTVCRYDGTDLILSRVPQITTAGTSPNESYIEKYEDGSMTQTRTMVLTQSSISILDRTVAWNTPFSAAPFVTGVTLNSASTTPGITQLAIFSATSTSTEVTVGLRRQNNETDFGGSDTVNITVSAKGFWF